LDADTDLDKDSGCLTTASGITDSENDDNDNNDGIT
jgi:hypothetical protein